MSARAANNVLIIGGTRFSGLYLWRELHQRGHAVTLFNRGQTPLVKLPFETETDFDQRLKATRFIKGDRKDPYSLKQQLGGESFDAVYDMNGREAADTAPLADMFKGRLEHFVYMSSAGVYRKSALMPHTEGDEEDLTSRHKGKLEAEKYLQQCGLPFTSIRPTYIYGPLNYNPLEEYFFSRVDQGRAVCIPGNGQHLTGLCHAADLATAMAQVLGREQAKGQIYNVQDPQAVTFVGLARLCARAAGEAKATETSAAKTAKTGKIAEALKIKYYDSSLFDFGDKKAFPMREQHFFCSVDKAMRDLDWTPKFTLAEGLLDSYKHDFRAKKAAGELQFDFTCDESILNDDRVAVKVYDGIPDDILRGASA